MTDYKISDFLALRKSKQSEGFVPGVYLICNKSTHKYYVGQSQCPADRAFLHFTGRGNGDVYADYKAGFDFSIRFYAFDPNDYRDLNELEYHLIRIYQSDCTGYNRQRGNSTRSVAAIESR